MDIKDIITTKNSCNCTKIEESICDLCRKPISVIDSPFGAIPTLKMMQDYIDYISTYLYDYLNNCLNILKEQVTTHQNETKSSLLKKVEENLQEIDQKSNQVLERITLDYNSKSKSYQHQYELLEQQYQGLITKYNAEISSKMQQLDKKIDNLTSLSNQTQDITTKSINYLLQIMEQVLKMNETFIQSKEVYIDMILPDYKRLIQDVQVLTKILPTEIRSVDIHGQSSEEFFQNRKQLINPYQLGKNRSELISQK